MTSQFNSAKLCKFPPISRLRLTVCETLFEFQTPFFKYKQQSEYLVSKSNLIIFFLSLFFV